MVRDSFLTETWHTLATFVFSSSSLFLSVSRADAESAWKAFTSICLVSVPSLFQCLHFSSPDLLSRCQSTFSFVFLCFSHLWCSRGVSCVWVDYLPSFPRRGVSFVWVDYLPSFPRLGVSCVWVDYLPSFPRRGVSCVWVDYLPSFPRDRTMWVFFSTFCRLCTPWVKKNETLYSCP